MKYTNIILVFALLLIANATTVQQDETFFASLSDLSEISHSSYGKNLLDTVTIALKNGGDISSVQKLLNSLLKQLVSDQEKSDIAWGIENKRLTDKINKLAKEIKDLTEEIRELNLKLKKLEKLIASSKNNLVQYNHQKNKNIKTLKTLKELRDGDAADYERSQIEHKDISEAISLVIKELTRLVGSISGKGKPEEISEIDQEKRDRLYKNAFLQITAGDEDETAAFIQMATSADQAQLKKLISILRLLKQSTDKSLRLEAEKEQNSKKLFKKASDAINSDISRLSTMIIKQEKNLKGYLAEKVQTEKSISLAENLKRNKETQRTAAIKEKDLKEEAYIKEKKERTEELEVVKRLIKIVETRLANMSKYLSSNTGA